MSVSFGKIKVKAAFMRAWLPVLLVLLGLGAALLPALGSAQVQEDIPAWQKTIKDTPPAQPGCFAATYPSMQWQQVDCGQPPLQSSILQRPPQWGTASSTGAAPEPQAVTQSAIGGLGYSASAVGGPISAADGSFINVTGVTSITDMSETFGSDVYSLQLNTNYFIVPGSDSLCNNSSSYCRGWVQFVYQNYGLPDAGSNENNGSLFIEYWLENASPCPASWSQPVSGLVSCVHNSTSLMLPGLSIADFNDRIDLQGMTSNGIDTVTLTIGGQAYSLSTPSTFSIFPQLWQLAQFNVFGAGDYSVVNFNNGSSLTVRTQIDNGTTNAPNCSNTAATGESNNLNYNSPCCPYGGGKPSIAFVEGTDTNANKYTCAALGNNTITPVVTPTGSGTISPGVLYVPNNVISTFTVTPNTSYTLASVTGCGGTRSGNTFTTAPATGSCTVTASFTSSNPIITATAGTGGSISPSGSIAVASGTTRTFTLTPNANYQVSSVGGTCGGTLSGNTYTTRAITAACTVTAAFVYSPTYYNVTASAGTGGTISPVGTLSTASGTTRTFTLTPSANYKVSSVGGTCGGTLSGSTFTTRAITAACTVTAAFVYSPTYYNVTASAGTGGTISPTGALSTASGTTRTFTLTPNANYKVSSVTGTCGGTLSGNTFTTKAITAACTVVANFVSSVTYYNVTASAGTGGTISPSGTLSTASGTTRTFTLTPSANYKVSSVGGTCGGTLSGNTFTTKAITTNCTVTAAFALPTYTITASASIGGTISPAGVITVGVGQTQAFTFTPNAGFGFGPGSYNPTAGTCPVVNWTAVGNYLVYTAGPITSNCTVAAKFAPYITASASGGGTISPSGRVQMATLGATQSFTLTPSSGYRISSVGGTCGGTLNGNIYTTRSITDGCTVTAAFALQTYTIMASASVGGTISPTGVITVGVGQTQTFTFTPNAGFGFGPSSYNPTAGTCPVVNWTAVGNYLVYTAGPITSNCTVAAKFAPYITASVSGGGTISPSGRVQMATLGATQSFTLTPSSGYRISSVSGTCGGTLSGNIYTTKSITSGCTVVAQFQ